MPAIEDGMHYDQLAAHGAEKIMWSIWSIASLHLSDFEEQSHIILSNKICGLVSGPYAAPAVQTNLMMPQFAAFLKEVFGTARSEYQRYKTYNFDSTMVRLQCNQQFLNWQASCVKRQTEGRKAALKLYKLPKSSRHTCSSDGSPDDFGEGTMQMLGNGTTPPTNKQPPKNNPPAQGDKTLPAGVKKSMNKLKLIEQDMFKKKTILKTLNWQLAAVAPRRVCLDNILDLCTFAGCAQYHPRNDAKHKIWADNLRSQVEEQRLKQGD